MLRLALLAVVALLPATSAAAAPRGEAVPVLMYHEIGVGQDVFARGLEVSPASFTAQVDWLARTGHHAVTLDALYRHWTTGAPLPSKPVVLTFDDGYRSDVTVAMPVLRAHGWAGVLNLQIGNLVPAQVRRLIAAGWEIDSHTFTHPDLTRVDGARLEHEVAASRTWIRDLYGVPVLFFCYPAGRFDARVVDAVRRAGYVGATTTLEGPASPANGMWTLHRVRVGGGEGVGALAARLGR
jgi:peptidoglycan/xylan/chitin deacetylase (PgdA/CDA1 family)